jgi:hypothetical protein
LSSGTGVCSATSHEKNVYLVYKRIKILQRKVFLDFIFCAAAVVPIHQYILYQIIIMDINNPLDKDILNEDVLLPPIIPAAILLAMADELEEEENAFAQERAVNAAHCVLTARRRLFEDQTPPKGKICFNMYD